MRKQRRLTTLLATSLRRKRAKAPKFGNRVNRAEKELVARQSRERRRPFSNSLSYTGQRSIICSWDWSETAGRPGPDTRGFCEGLEKLAAFRGDSTFWTWLYRIAYYTALDELRKKKREAGVVLSARTSMN